MAAIAMMMAMSMASVSPSARAMIDAEHRGAVAIPRPSRLSGASSSEPTAARRACSTGRSGSPPPSVTSGSGSTPGSEPPRRLSARLLPALSHADRRGRGWKEISNGEAAGAFHRTCHVNGVLSGKRRRDRRWGSRAEPFRSERSRRMRGADVARVARSPPAAAVGRASVRAICAAAGSCAGTPSTMLGS